MDIDIEKIKENIQKTGFVLEYKVSRILEENGWNVINNRYYLDDLQPVNREMDIVAYKVSEHEDILYYTSLIISCKKSESDIWSFLTKNANLRDRNINFCPIFNWSNDKVLDSMLQSNIEERKWELTAEHPHLQFIFGINDQVFAYQQLHKNNFTVQNDKDIYKSIESSIKALKYEIGSLDKRVQKKALYNFNILSIFDGDMVKIHFDDDERTVEEIDEIKYLNRLIFDEKESFYRVHFLKFAKLNTFIQHFNELHETNKHFYPSLVDEYYATFYEREGGIDLFFDKFKEKVLWNLYLIVEDKFKLDDIELEYNKDSATMSIGVSIANAPYKEETNLSNFLNQDEYIQKHIKKVFQDLYRYDGDFVFVNYTDLTLPF